MDGPNRPQEPARAKASGGQGAEHNMLDLGDANVAAVIMIMLLLGLMKATMTPCFCP